MDQSLERGLDAVVVKDPLELGRALVAAAGLTPQARGRMMLREVFRRGGPRIFERTGGEPGDEAHSVYRPLPPHKLPMAFRVPPMEEGSDGASW